MKIKPLLVQIRRRCFARWRSLPLFGPLLEDFLQWLHDQNYAVGTMSHHMEALPKVVGWLRRHHVTSLVQLTQRDLQVAHDHFRLKQDRGRWAVWALKRFLSERHLVPEGNSLPPSPVEVEVGRFATYLRETRGAAEATISGHSVQLRAFLRFLRFDGKATPLRHLEPRLVEDFLRKAARTNNRFSMQHIVGTVRAYLKERHAQGVMIQPLHLRIDTLECIAEKGCRAPFPGGRFSR